MFTVLLVFCIGLAGMAWAETEEGSAAAWQNAFETVAELRYEEYAEQHQEQLVHGAQITLAGPDAVEYTDAEVGEADGRAGLMTGEKSAATWLFTVEQAGLYTVEIDYYTTPGTGSAIERALYLDGELPFNESYNLSFSRVYMDDGEITVGYNGDDMRPDQIEIANWYTAYARDQFGYFGQALYYYLPEGEHTLTLVALREPMGIGEIRLVSQRIVLPAYEEYLQRHTAGAAEFVTGVLEGGLVKTQAEDTYQRSSFSLFAVNDSSSYNTEPYDVKYKRINAVGGSKWRNPGEWMSWEISVPEDGMYYLGGRSKQNFHRDLYSSRTLRIDGEIPFQEAENIAFSYSDKWKVEYFGGQDAPYAFYLTAGKHVITLDGSLGDIKDELMRCEVIMTDLNNISLELLAVLGNTPDTDRDYQIARYMPELLEKMTATRLRLEEVRDSLLAKVGNSDSLLSQMDQLIFLMEEIVDKPDRIAEMFSRYRSLIRTFGNLIMEARQQPLRLDYIFVAEKDAKLPKAEMGFFQSLWRDIQSFALSFVMDYSNLSSIPEDKRDEVITVWIGNNLSGGRDQATTLNKMIVENFTVETGIVVDLKLVPAGTILSATLAGNGPDVALQIDEGSTVNYAMRNALYDLSSFEDYSEIADRFPAAAVTPYAYQGKPYALPETFGFKVMFYRTDIMRKLGVDVADIRTWQDVINLLPTLQSQNMSFGLGTDSGVFSTMLYQRGGSYYAVLDAKE